MKIRSDVYEGTLKPLGLNLFNHTAGAHADLGAVFELPVWLDTSAAGILEMGAFTVVRHSTAFKNVKIGRYTAIGSKCEFGSPEHPKSWLWQSSVFIHDYPWTRNDRSWDLRPGMRYNGTVIGNDVLISRDVFIKQGVTVGDGAMIAARAAVTKDVPPYAIVAGVPAKVIGYRFDEATIERLLKAKWWNYRIDFTKGLDATSPLEILDWMEANPEKLQPFEPRRIEITKDMA